MSVVRTALHRWATRAAVALALLGLAACGPKTPAQLLRSGRLFDACELADYRYPERSEPTRVAMRQASGLRIEIELLDREQAAALVGVPLREPLPILRYRIERGSGNVTTDLVVEELRVAGEVYVPTHLSESMAVALVAEPDDRAQPDGLLQELLLMGLVFAATPLCLGRAERPCDFSKLKFPAHEQLARRNRERLAHVNADPQLRATKERLLQLLGRPSRSGPRVGSIEGYQLLLRRDQPGPRDAERVRFVAHHTLHEPAGQCALIDRFTVETSSVNDLFASRPRLQDLDLRELTIWPDEKEVPLLWR